MNKCNLILIRKSICSNLNIINTKYPIRYSFLLCFVGLIASYFIYGKIIERVSGVDANAETPVQRLEDGVDYTPIGKFKLFLIHFLNIAGLGPIFGVIQGALFCPAAFLWIPLEQFS